MTTKQGDIALLNDPVAQKLLQSAIPARMAYVWSDGTPRVEPIWFHWDGKQVVMASPGTAPKAHVLKTGDKVAITIDANEWPYKVLMIRGTAEVTIVAGMVPEYALAAERYFGKEGGQGWLAQVGKMGISTMVRVAVTPAWVGIIDFEQRFPSPIAKAMAAMG
jgi:Pyridoxamine 5'-phosphate oxidase